MEYIATAAPWFSTFFENASRKSLREQLQEIVHDYMRKFGVDAVPLDTVAEWADRGRVPVVTARRMNRSW